MRVVGSYQLVEQIGRGGMGEVWLAQHALLGRRAAIKLLRPDISNDQEVVTRFFNEARAATAIQDPGIVQVYDFGYADDGAAYIVMELLHGETLDRRLSRVGALAVGDALRIARQVASTLGEAHTRQIVHRDLKPENIYIVRDPEVPSGERVKILDFGIAKLVNDPFAVKTHTSALLGTPMYMSPEQCRGNRDIDQRADIYSLGCVLYTLLAGEPPFMSDGLGDLIAMHMFQAARPLSHHRGDIPPELEQLIATCMAKEPAARFSSGAALASALDSLLARVSSDAIARASAGSLPPRASKVVPAIAPAMTMPTRPAAGWFAPTPEHVGKRAETTLSSSGRGPVAKPDA